MRHAVKPLDDEVRRRLELFARREFVEKYHIALGGTHPERDDVAALLAAYDAEKQACREGDDYNERLCERIAALEEVVEKADELRDFILDGAYYPLNYSGHFRDLVCNYTRAREGLKK